MVVSLSPKFIVSITSMMWYTNDTMVSNHYQTLLGLAGIWQTNTSSYWTIPITASILTRLEQAFSK